MGMGFGGFIFCVCIFEEIVIMIVFWHVGFSAVGAIYSVIPSCLGMCPPFKGVI